MKYSTDSTVSTRSGSFARAGTSYGIRAFRIFFFALTSRCAVVASGSTNARAISRVVKPPSVRSARVQRASGASAG